MVPRTLVQSATMTIGTLTRRLDTYRSRVTLLLLGRCTLSSMSENLFLVSVAWVVVMSVVALAWKFPPESYAPSTRVKATLLLTTKTCLTSRVKTFPPVSL